MRVRESLRKNSALVTLIVIVVFCFVSLGISTDSLSLSPQSIGQTFFGTIQRGFSAIGGFFARTLTSVRELRTLRSEYDELVEQLRSTERVAGDIETLERENTRLRNALGFSGALEHQNIPARVIAKEPGSFFAGLTINRGQAAGIARNMPVVANENGGTVLVGRVIEVGAATSVVMPVFDSRSYVASRFERSRHEGLVRGLGMSTNLLEMNYVSESARPQIVSGDVVVTSGMRSIYPEGIQIGTVAAIRGESYETSLRIDLEPIVDFSRLEYVFVLEVLD